MPGAQGSSPDGSSPDGSGPAHSTFEGATAPGRLLTTELGGGGRVHERPDLLGDTPPVGGRPEAGQYGVEPEVDPLQDGELGRNVGPLDHLVAGIEEGP